MPENGNSDPITAGIRRTLEYFELFNYPLLPAEIHRFHPLDCSVEEILTTLEIMQTGGTVFCSRDGFYTISKHESWSDKRTAGNIRAQALLSRSGRFTRIISSFPFVDAIAISGSLSKFYAGKNADIDYFIITARNRLWIARSLLHLFKKLTFIAGYQHYFCMNYFIDTEAFVLTDKNIYTAIELATMIPVYGQDKVVGMMKLNTWLRDYLPNDTGSLNPDYLESARPERIKHLAERVINTLNPEKLNIFLMRLTDRKWRAKWSRKGFPMADYNRAFHTSLHISKNHPADFQKRILLALGDNAGLTAN